MTTSATRTFPISFTCGYAANSGLSFPTFFATVAVPKTEELIATPYRHESKEEAEAFFLAGMTDAMRRIAEQAHPGFPVTIYYAFKTIGDQGRSRYVEHGLGDFS